jgi:predicted AlkP superfamily pyrophosphatase or phosphodiesterase
MKRLLSIASLLVITAATNALAQNISRPKLVVGIVIDQMRWDYLYRYYPRYTDGGFRRLMDKGFNCQNTFINYLPSYTAPGHACIYTGSIPAIHGIASNDWPNETTGLYQYCTGDTCVEAVGGSMIGGSMSPANLQVSTITDELRLATNMQSRVYGIALKDRGSILPAGHLANCAFWFDDSTGNFMTSTFYAKQLPAWVSEFNAKRYADTFFNQQWELSYPLNTYTQSTGDDNKYELPFPGEARPVFPHRVTGFKKRSGYNGLRYTPGGNTLTLKIAKACIKNEELGQRSATDFLCISFSSTDYAGHRFSPNSVEVEDMFLKLDEELASFFRYLDKHVGEGNYTLFLTADHGGAHNMQYLRDLKMPAGNFDDSAIFSNLNKHLAEKFGKPQLVRVMMNYQVFLDEATISAAKLDRNAIKNAIINWLQKQDGVAWVVNMEDLANCTVPEPVKTMVINGYNRKRSGSLQIIMQPAWYGEHGKTGTTHGLWNPYDTHIPLLWYGWGIPKGQTHRTTHMTDIAATLAALLHIQMPNGCVGEVIGEVVE